MPLPKELREALEAKGVTEEMLTTEVEYPNEDGEPTKVTLEEALESPMFKADYTKKTQELSDERKRIDETLDTKLNEFFTGMFEEDGTPTKPAEEEKPETPEDEVKLLRKKVEELSTQVTKTDSQSRVEKFEREITTQLKQLEVEFPQMRAREVLAAVISGQSDDLRGLAEASHKAETERRKSTIAEYLEGKLSTEGLVPKKAAGSGGPAPTKQPETLKEAKEAAREWLKTQEE